MATIERVLILGAGALGAMYARAMASVEGVEVSFLADEKRAKRLRTDGVVVNGTLLELPVNPPAGTIDLLLVALKHHQLSAGIELARPYVGNETLIVSVMNGIESERTLAEAFGPQGVVHCVALGMDALREENRVKYTRMGRLLIGRGYSEVPSERLEELSAFFDFCGIEHEVLEDILRAVWNKFMLNVGINQLSAVLGAPYGIFQKEESAKRLLRSAMIEVVAIAEAEGVNLHPNDIEPWFDIVATLSPEGKTSMLQDIEAGRKTEVEMFAGTVVALGKKHAILTPLNEALLEMVRLKELMASA
ncbi:MAG: ketopantoate reductase family protein [Spirochaetaceae bacterium]